MASEYTHVFVIVGDNGAKSKSISQICQKFIEFCDAVWPTEVKFAEHMRRKDLLPQLVSKNNMYLRNKLGCQLKGTRIIRREDFSDACRFHFDKLGEGYLHMAALIFSVLREFAKDN